MKINIKDVFEKEDKDIRIHTNDRLDIDEIFSEAREDKVEEEQFPSNEVEIDTAQEEAIQEDDGLNSDIDSAEAVENDECSISSEPCSSDEDEVPGEENDSSEEHEDPDLECETVEVSAEDIEGEDNESILTEVWRVCKAYRSHAAVAASFLAIILAVIVYTTMIPREVNATINGEPFTFSSRSYTVEDFLEDTDIALDDEDYISVPLDTFIYDGIELKIKHATDFKVTADGKTKSYKTLANTVGQALDDINVKVDPDDIVKPNVDTLLAKGMEITVKRVQIKKEVITEKVPFKTVEKDDSSLNEGTSKVVKRACRKDKVTYKVKYIDGVESSRKEVKRSTVKPVVNKVIANGTRISFDGRSYSRKLVVKAYAYTGGGRTAMGTSARVGEIAVDPSVIPLGTNVYIEGVGARRAEDTGGNIKGDTIDIYMNTESECRSWGVRYITIYIQ